MHIAPTCPHSHLQGRGYTCVCRTYVRIPTAPHPMTTALRSSGSRLTWKRRRAQRTEAAPWPSRARDTYVNGIHTRMHACIQTFPAAWSCPPSDQITELEALSRCLASSNPQLVPVRESHFVQCCEPGMIGVTLWAQPSNLSLEEKTGSSQPGGDVISSGARAQGGATIPRCLLRPHVRRPNNYLQYVSCR